jgi:D-glycerate 3-kinase
MADKTQLIEDWLEPLYEAHRRQHAAEQRPPPFFLGLTGLQGSGKSYLVERLTEHFASAKTRLKRTEGSTGNLHVVAYSLDDLYLSLKERQQRAQETGNALWRVRGQFGTHDVPCAKDIVQSLKAQKKQTKIPRFDKALAHGLGDRLPTDAWQVVDTQSQGCVDLVLFEGWGLGMRALGKAGLQARLEELEQVEDVHSQARKHAFKDLMQVDEALHLYQSSFTGPDSPLQALLVLEAQELGYVYTWRLQQEHHLRSMRDGQGMSDEEVEAFIDTYYSSYELYLPALLTRGFFDGVAGAKQGPRQLILTQDIKRALVCSRTLP